MASRILLADDSITIQKVVNLTFADEGIEVVAVSNGDLAERRLTEVNPDLVLADIFMPGKNGYELCEAIKGNSQFRHVPVVLLVGAFEPFDQVEARRVRADAHLTKPFESRTLVETVRRLISAVKPATGPIAQVPAPDERHDEAVDALGRGAAPGPVAAPLPVKLDLSAMMAESGIAPSALPARSTGELASPAPNASQDILDLGFADAPPIDVVSAPLTDTTQQFEPLEFSSNGDFSPGEPATSFGMHPQEMIQDFDLSEPLGPAGLASQDPISFEAEASALPEVDVSGAGEGEQWYNRESFDTTRFDQPSNDAGWQSPAASSSPGYQSPDFRQQTEAGYAASEASTETACATLLAVDEPLGDVLFDESVSVDPQALSRMASGDALGLEFAEPEVTEVAAADAMPPPVSTQFDLVDSGPEPPPEASFPFEENTAVLEPFASEESPIQFEEGPIQEERVESVATSPDPDSQPASHEIGGDAGWTTPRTAAYSTAQLESVVTPMDGEKCAAETAGDQDLPEPEAKDEASFTTATMWTEEEARFTPIDIEAVAVEEAPAEEIGVLETGFAFSSLPPEEPVASVEMPAAAAENTADASVDAPVASSQETPSGSSVETPFAAGDEAPFAASVEIAGTSESASAPARSEVSTAAIEEIVRRVIAEMSEAVVREVAWEVVPDCVERVIDQLTRESLSKRA